MLFLFRNVTFSPQWRRNAGVVDMIVGLAVVGLRLVWLSRAGEQPLVSVARVLRPAQAGQALGNLNRLNAFLASVLPTRRSDKQYLTK